MFTRKNVVLNAGTRGGPVAPNSAIPSRTPVSTPLNARSHSEGHLDRHTQSETPDRNRIIDSSHPGLRPSLVDSHPCVSSSSRTLDQIMQHGGLPLGTLTLIEEHGTTDFASSLLKGFCTHGISEKRSGLKSIVICVGIPDWLKSLPAVAVSTASKHSKPSTDDTDANRMKIAWRYEKLNKARPVNPAQMQPNANYCQDLNFRSSLLPAGQVGEECYYALGRNLKEILHKLRALLEKIGPGTLVRVVVPNLLHPAVYTPGSSSPTNVVPFLHLLRQLSVKYNAATMVSIPLQLYPRTRSVVASLERACDNCLELEPFDTAVVSTGDSHGLLHIHRLAGLSDKGMMVEHIHEYAFKLGKHQLEIVPFGIPVEETDDAPQQPVSGSVTGDAKKTDSTKVNLDF